MVADEFYRGQTARDLSDEMAKSGGLITMEDLAAYKAKLREPLTASYQTEGREMGSDHQPAAKLRRNCDDRGAEYFGADSIERLGGRGIRALGCGSDAPGFCRPRNFSG